MADLTDEQRERASELLRHLPEVVWDVATWVPGQHFVHGTVDVADRSRIVAEVLRAAPALDRNKPDPVGSHSTG